MWYYTSMALFLNPGLHHTMTPHAHIFISLDQALARYPCPGLTPDLVVYLAKHHGILPYSEHPTEGFLVHEEAYQRIAQDLNQVRHEAHGYIRGKDATRQFGYNTRMLYKLVNHGSIRRGSHHGELLCEDVAFFARLADLVALPMGKALLPPAYNPAYD